MKPQDLVLVSSPTLERFEDALQRVRQMVGSPREMDERREFVFYYSGHSDDDGLILGKDRSLGGSAQPDQRHPGGREDRHPRLLLLGLPHSGEGRGQARPAFLFDASSDMTGHAYLTSASAEEAAQESDRIGSSFFTHFLISGLRGAADTEGDGTVTLNEAYTYAFQETLASTEKTRVRAAASRVRHQPFGLGGSCAHRPAVFRRHPPRGARTWREGCTCAMRRALSPWS